MTSPPSDLPRQIGEGGEIGFVVADGFENPDAVALLARRGRERQFVARHDGIDKGIGLILGEGRRKLGRHHGMLGCIGWGAPPQG